MVVHDAALATHLTRQFIEWERRGRGWQTWEQPVHLEPPFRPFRRIYPRADFTDTGRIPGLWERLTGMWKDNGATRQALSPEPLPEPEPRFLPLEAEPPLEVRLLLPPDTKIRREVIAQLLLSLGTYGPLAFEVLGQEQGVSVQFTCPSASLDAVKGQLETHLPEAKIETSQLDPFWLWAFNSDMPASAVDFGLSYEWFIPLASRSYDPDPLALLISILSEMNPGEAGLFQVLFTPVRAAWSESLLQSLAWEDGETFFQDAPELLKRAHQKISSPLYAVSFRVAAWGERSWESVQALGHCLMQLAANPGGNELIPLNQDGYSLEDQLADIVLRRTRRSGMLLNAEELVSFLHPPSSAIKHPRLLRHGLRSKAAPSSAVGHPYRLGSNTYAGETAIVCLSTEQRTRHIHVLGASGSGKSTLLLNLILQDIAHGEGLAVLDPHGDLIDEILSRIPEERINDVVLIDPADEEFPVGFNILHAHSELEKNLLASDLTAVFRRLSTSWGDQMTSVLGNAILAFLESRQGGTLSDLRRFLVDPDYRRSFLETVEDPEIVYYWRREFPLLSGKPQGPILTRLDTFLRPKTIRRMVGQKENRLNFADIMDSRKIFLARLAQGAVGEENSYLLGTLLISKFHQLAISRQVLKAEQRTPYWLYIDECHHFMTPSMASILSGARKYKLGLVLAHQELNQLGKDTDAASAVLANPFTRICFRLGDTDARKLADGFSYFEEKDLQNLGVGEAIGRIGRAEDDFNLSVPMLPSVDQAIASERRQQIIAFSREKYGMPRAEVDRLLAEAHAALRQADERVQRTSPVRPERPALEFEPVPPTTETDLPTAPATLVEALATAPVSQQETADSEAPRKPTDQTPASPPLWQATLGRGGREHKALQQHLKLVSENLGWMATLEKPTPSGGSVDVLLEKQDHPTIACEVSVSTRLDYEVQNAKKCLDAGFPIIVFVAQEQKRVEKLQARFQESFSTMEMSRLHTMTIGMFAHFLQSREFPQAETVSTNRGRKVHVTYKLLPQDELTRRRDSLQTTISRSLGKPTKIPNYDEGKPS